MISTWGEPKILASYRTVALSRLGYASSVIAKLVGISQKKAERILGEFHKALPVRGDFHFGVALEGGERLRYVEIRRERLTQFMGLSMGGLADVLLTAAITWVLTRLRERLKIKAGEPVTGDQIRENLMDVVQTQKGGLESMAQAAIAKIVLKAVEDPATKIALDSLAVSDPEDEANHAAVLYGAARVEAQRMFGV